MSSFQFVEQAPYNTLACFEDMIGWLQFCPPPHTRVTVFGNHLPRSPHAVCKKCCVHTTIHFICQSCITHAIYSSFVKASWTSPWSACSKECKFVRKQTRTFFFVPGCNSEASMQYWVREGPGPDPCHRGIHTIAMGDNQDVVPVCFICQFLRIMAFTTQQTL